MINREVVTIINRLKQVFPVIALTWPRQSGKTTLLKELGGFDENLAPPIYAFNELDVGVRINKSYPNSIKFEPQALVYHHQFPQGGTHNNFSPREVHNSTQWNYGYFLGKNYSFFKNFLSFSRRVIFQLIHEPGAIPHIIRGLVAGKKIRFSSR